MVNLRYTGLLRSIDRLRWNVRATIRCCVLEAITKQAQIDLLLAPSYLSEHDATRLTRRLIYLAVLKEPE